MNDREKLYLYIWDLCNFLYDHSTHILKEDLFKHLRRNGYIDTDTYVNSADFKIESFMDWIRINFDYQDEIEKINEVIK